MRYRFLRFTKPLIVSISCMALFSFLEKAPVNKPHFHFPYKKAGLTERQAAAHLLSRFTFGATPGQVDQVVDMGLEKWFEQQLEGGLPDDSLQQRLSGYDALKLTNKEVVANFPRPGQILKMAIADGIINKDSVNAIKTDRKEYRDQIAAYMKQKGMRPQQELFRQFINQKILRAAYSNNQLQEVLTDFWFNHFNVSITKNDCSEFIPAYERDVIRPNVTGKFDNLLMATAKSPAMLLYLDNFTSSGINTNQQAGNQRFRKLIEAKIAQVKDTQQLKNLDKLKAAGKAQGLNENYAREVMELHTLGVDGGYTQSDVTQAARVLTGWTIYPMSDEGYGKAIKNIIDKIGEDKLAEKGFVHDGDFLFAVNRHDNKEKIVLGKTFAADGGYDEGVQLLEMLAHHPSTAKFISRKLAVRFVSDNPPQSLIDKMAKTFMDKNGDIKEVLITMASSPEFWSQQVIREKTKSPFELAISAIRAVNADIQMPYQVFQWVDKMGQKMYFYQAPTGFPDNGQYWINTGSLLNRMNFGLAIASQRIPGTKMDLLALNNHHEPESPGAALITFSKLMMPERDLGETVKRLTPMLTDPTLVTRVNDAVAKTPVAQNTGMTANEDMTMNDEGKDGKVKDKPGKGFRKNNNAAIQTVAGNNTMLAQVVGIIIGSPEFQRK